MTKAKQKINLDVISQMFGVPKEKLEKSFKENRKAELYESIRQLREQTPPPSFQTIAKILGLTRQRVHQIYTHRNCLRDSFRQAILVRDYFTCRFPQHPEEIKTYSVRVFCIDNSLPQTPEKFVTICSSCQVRVSKELVPFNPKKFICLDCGREHTSREKPFSTKRCPECIAKRNSFWSPKHRLNSCIDCGTTKRRHSANGRCSYCRQNFELSTRPHRREAHRLNSLRYASEHKEERRLATRAWREKKKYENTPNQ